MRTLNITNGDGAAGVLKASSVAGDVLPWRDPMHHGPFPAGLSLDDLRPLRAQYLAGPEGDIQAVERDFRLRDDHLKASANYDRVILWFEHDLLDQLQILQILDWFASADLQATHLQLICIDAFPGIDGFRGIGQLDKIQMASLLGKRTDVTKGMVQLAQAGWAAFRSASPLALMDFINSDLSLLPFLKAALQRHLEEFPGTKSGLNRTEQQIISLVSQGVDGPVDLFLQNMDYETALFVGDWSTYSVIDRLCEAGILHTQNGSFFYPSFTAEQQNTFRDQRLNLTDFGQKMALGERDAFGALPRNMWIGGVHIHSEHSFWTWDAEGKKPVRLTR